MTKTPIETLLLQYGNSIEKILTDRSVCRGSMLSNALKNASDKDVFSHALIAALLCSTARAAPRDASGHRRERD